MLVRSVRGLSWGLSTGVRGTARQDQACRVQGAQRGRLWHQHIPPSPMDTH